MVNRTRVTARIEFAFWPPSLKLPHTRGPQNGQERDKEREEEKERDGNGAAAEEFGHPTYDELMSEINLQSFCLCMYGLCVRREAGIQRSLRGTAELDGRPILSRHRKQLWGDGQLRVSLFETEGDREGDFVVLPPRSR